MFILNFNVNNLFHAAFHVIRNLSVFPIHSLIILKLQTVTQFVWAPCACFGAFVLANQVIIAGLDTRCSPD